MPSTSTRGFIVRPIQDNTEPEAEPEFESVNIQACSEFYSSVEERIKDKMLEKIEEFLESNQFHDLSVLVITYQKFKELHP